MRYIFTVFLAVITFAGILFSNSTLISAQGGAPQSVAGELQSSFTAEGFKILNGYRAAIGLPLIAEKPELRQSAQAHANYLARNRMLSHYQDRAYPGFIGASVKDRAAVFGYRDTIGEGLSTVSPVGGMGVDSLMDAPYHRLLHIDPNFTEAGMGFTLEPNFTVINYGAPLGLSDARVVMYPYPGQQDAKIGWKAVESPNPLSAYGKENAYVGYPISLSIHDQETIELKVAAAELRAAGGQAVHVYVIDSSKEEARKKHIFLIPKSPLSPGQTYTARIEGQKVTAQGEIPLVQEWSFTTLRTLEIAAVSLEKMGSANYLALRLKNGELEDLEYTIKRDGDLWQKYQGDRYLRYYLEQPLAGSYTLEITSRAFTKPPIYDVSIDGSGVIIRPRS